ncbi:hypothetical protein DMJ13_24720 [halophilic archaeon]|nr:hypothetical protein DMJ13_24720 [halophilic archaeon]
MADPVELVERSLADATRDEFDRRVAEQAASVTAAVRDGRLANPGFALGLECELYAVDDDARLARLPEEVFDGPCERELGLHNAELHTAPSPFAGEGIESQVTQLRRQYQRAQRVADRHGVELVLDGMWTVPPPEGTVSYLGGVDERDDVTVAENMTVSPRYYAIDNDVLDRAEGTLSLTVPGTVRDFPSILFESLTSSIQPHVQVPDPERFPQYYNTAIRTLGPVLALATNSPLLPPDLYDVGDPYELFETTFHELRIPVFEQSVNAGWEKVRFPDDIRTTTDVVDNLVADPTCAPFLREWIAGEDSETFDDQFWELGHKRGTYWRWLRGVVGGQPVGEGDQWSIRIEYRPLPTQPTITGVVGFQCLVAGLLRGLVSADHPLPELDHGAAERSFYSAVESGLDADLAWITADGVRTTNAEEIYEEVFDFARSGLREQGVPTDLVETYLGPIELRWDRRTTPSRWKLARVREHLDRTGSLEVAIREMQTEYVRRAGTTAAFTYWGQ